MMFDFILIGIGFVAGFVADNAFGKRVEAWLDRAISEQRRRARDSSL